MPNAIAPSAPCVEVWLSPHAIVMPGCVSPSSGPITWTMPWSSLSGAQRRMPNVAAVALERASSSPRPSVEERPPLRARSARCDRRWRRCARETRPSSRAGAACRTPAGSSLRGRDAGRRTAASVRSAACARRARSRLSERVCQPCDSFVAQFSRAQPIEYTDASISCSDRVARAGRSPAGLVLTLRGQAPDASAARRSSIGRPAGDRRGRASRTTVARASRPSAARARARSRRTLRDRVGAVGRALPAGPRHRQVPRRRGDAAIGAPPCARRQRHGEIAVAARRTPTSTSCASTRRGRRGGRRARCASGPKCEYAQAAYRVHATVRARTIRSTRRCSGTCR